MKLIEMKCHIMHIYTFLWKVSSHSLIFSYAQKKLFSDEGKNILSLGN